MRYGFVIDNRKCIGCHACTVACKSEHDVPVGVNRTWVKQVEKGEYPNTRRVFSVMRCNHCTDAPCVEICPTSALFVREDGIVDFDNRRCIGCKSCMQACPYDALYIDPETHTAAKCNYCAHRVDVGLEPACVNVCPEHAIISGDMDNKESEIAQLLSREQVTVRKAEKGTSPNLFYINGDEASLNPIATEQTDTFIWSQQTTGVGHFAKYAEKIAAGKDLLQEARKNAGLEDHQDEKDQSQVEALIKSKSRRVYDTPDKGLLWGWEVSGYVWTKAIATGLIIVPFLAMLMGENLMRGGMGFSIMGTSLLFLIITTVLLVKDLDQPKRFLFVMLRPHFKSWLVRGGYSLTIFGGLLTLMIVAHWLDWASVFNVAFWGTAITGLIVAVYTAFLFAQAKGRDFWQSPALSIHMLVHSLMSGAAVLSIISYFYSVGAALKPFLFMIIIGGIILNVLTMAFELFSAHPTKASSIVAHHIVLGKYATMFWALVVIIGNAIPITLMLIDAQLLPFAAAFVLAGIYFTEKIWVEAPQKISLK